MATLKWENKGQGWYEAQGTLGVYRAAYAVVPGVAGSHSLPGDIFKARPWAFDGAAKFSWQRRTQLCWVLFLDGVRLSGEAWNGHGYCQGLKEARSRAQQHQDAE